MEQKQNAKPLTIEEQIDLIWKSNSRIPFMQSKEILGLGYREGRKSISEKAAIENLVKTAADNSFTSTSKELIAYTEKEVSKKKEAKQEQKTVYINASESDIEQAVYDLLNELVNKIEDSRDLVTIYTYVKNKQMNSSKKLRTLKNKFGTK